MCAVENGYEFVWFSSHQALRQPLSKLSFLQQVGLLCACKPLFAYKGQVCLMPRRFFPLWIDKEKGFVINRWPGAYDLLEDQHFRLWSSPQGMQLEQGKGRVYLNGQPIQKALLHDGDWILAGGHSFFWSAPILLAPSLLADPFGQSLPLHHSTPRPFEIALPASLFESPNTPTVFKIEPPPLFQEEKMGFASFNKGGMMAMSALTSLISSFFIKGQGNQIQGLFPALLSTLSFMGFYAWQATQQKNEKKVANRDALEQYLTYLKEEFNSLESLRQEKRTQFLNQKQRMLHLDPSLKHSQSQSPWTLPVGLFKTPCLTLELPDLSWQFQHTLQGQVLEQLKEAEIETPAWQCLHQGQVGFICAKHENQLLQLYLLWCWMVFTPTRRFAWIGFPTPSRLHPASLLEGESLYFETLKDFLACKTRFSSIEWTICVHDSLLTHLDWSTIFSPSLFPTPSSFSSCHSSFHPNSWPQSAHLKETWLLCLKDPTFQVGLQTFKSVPLFLEATLPSSKAWRESAYELSSLQERFTLPHFWQASFKPEVTLQQLANLKVEIGPGIFWDLKQEGPHALVAGVTGSGKSEGLCSILFQLAFQNSAKLLQFVLIDFKGGSFSVPLQDLPHTVACLTNLASQEIVRLEKALQQELDRRQHILSTFLKAHPDCPPDLDHCLDPKTGKMFSHILICVDEFGQLKARFPDFMKFLQESARIGRSLGLHLILSTQKPAGLVDEQIWSNAKTKLCFPVLDAADSREVLGHDGARQLSKSGEFILQVTGESEKKGRAFYLKRSAQGTSPLFLRVQGLWQEKPTTTFQDAIRQAILVRQEKVDPLLMVDPKEEADTFSGVWSDCLTHKATFVLPQGLVIAIGQAQNLEILLAQLAWTYRQENKIVLNASLLSIPYTQVTTLSSLWSIPSQDFPLLILVEVDRFPQTLLEELLSQKQFTVLLFASQITFRQEMLLSKANLKILAQVSSKDQLALVSEGRLRQEEGFPVVHALYPDKIERLIVGKRIPLKKEVENLASLPAFCLQQVQKDATLFSLLHLKPGLIGIESKSLKPIYLGPSGLTIAWSLPSAKEQALNLALRLQLENPLLEVQSVPTKGQLCLLDASKSMDPANTLKQALEEMPVVFLGKGLNTWQYLLQLALPLETNGNGLYLDKDIALDIQSATLQENLPKEG